MNTDVIKCRICKQIRPISDFYFRKDNGKLRTECKKCHKEKVKQWELRHPSERRRNAMNYFNNHKEKCLEYCRTNKEWISKRQKMARRNNPSWEMYRRIRCKSKQENIPFNLDPTDIVIPSCCPILGIQLEMGNTTVSDNSPSIDRIYPKLGYIKGNIEIISNRANRIKSDATLDELKKIVHFLEILACKHCSDAAVS